MPEIMAVALPDGALLQHYAARPECYTDCFAAHVPHHVSLREFVTAFYHGRLFRLERVILRLTGNPSNDGQIDALFDGSGTRFAAWNMQFQTDDELLMLDVRGATCSWFRVEPTRDGTKLFFGSAVIGSAERPLGVLVRAFMPLHRLYSRLLLVAAVRDLP